MCRKEKSFNVTLCKFLSLPFNFFETDIGADVLDLAETMVATADGLVYEPVSGFHFLAQRCSDPWLVMYSCGKEHGNYPTLLLFY